MSQPFVEIALLQILLIVASLVFCVVISRRVRKIIIPLTQFKLRTLLIATGAVGMFLGVFKSNPQLIEAIFDFRYYYGFDRLLSSFLFSGMLFGGPLLGVVLFDNFRYERELRRERRERLLSLPRVSFVPGAKTSPPEPASPQWID